MKLRDIFLASGTLVLAGSAFLLNANKPFSVVTKLFYTVSTVCKHFTVVGNQFTTGNNFEVQASIITEFQQGTVQIWGACVTNGGVTRVSYPVHFHPF